MLEYVEKVHARAWIGRYRMKGDTMSAEFAGRCADRWMEATHEGEGLALGEELGAPRGYEFESLQPDGGCRSYLIVDPETKQAAIVDPIRERVDGKQNPRLKHASPEDFSGNMKRMQLPMPPNLGEVLQTNQRCLE